MPTHYRHTQRGTLTILVLLVAASAIAYPALIGPAASRWIAVGIALGLIVLACLFSSLTVTVNSDELRWYFGPGAWNYRISLHDIEGVRVVRNSVLSGFGIRVGPGFRLYNVSGLDAVEVRLKTGEIRRIGTDDPGGLYAALRT